MADEENVLVAVSPGVCMADPEEIEAMKTRTHDGLILLTGQHRRSGIRWSIETGINALAMLEATYADMSETDERNWMVETYRQYLVEHGKNAALVTAMCEVATGFVEPE